MKHRLSAFLFSTILILPCTAQQRVPVKYGDFSQWVTRELKESKIIGGNEKTLYEVGPTAKIVGNQPYVPKGGTPWGTSNVYAKVSGIVKGSNALFPHDRGGGNLAAKLCSQIESVKVLGIINMDVMVAGSMFLGRMIEPITSTKSPYSKMEMGVPISVKPKYLVFDYKLDMPNVDYRIKSTGFGSKKKLPGHDNAVVFVMLQRRWEDADGKLHAKRVATSVKTFSKGTDWVNGYKLPLQYGPAESLMKSNSNVAFRKGDTAYYAKNSAGKMVAVQEEGWDSADAVPTHAIVMFSAGSGEPYIGTEGLTFYIDNVAWEL